MTSDLNSQPSAGHESQAANDVLDLEAVLRLPQGRRVLMRVLTQCGVYRNAFSDDARNTDRRLGQQNIGLWLISEISQVGPTEYPRLLLDAATEANEETVHVLDEK